LLPFRHEGSQTAVKSALLDTQRALLIRATEMNAATSRLFVDFLFVDNCGANRFDGAKAQLLSARRHQNMIQITI